MELGEQENPFLLLEATDDADEYQCSPYLTGEKVDVVPAEAAGCYQGPCQE